MSGEIIEKYVWVTSDNACEACQELNGKEFKTLDEVPDKPHPNCKCTVEPVYGELCGCIELFEQLDEVAGEVQNSKKEADSVISYIQGVISYVQGLIQKYIISPIISAGQAIMAQKEIAEAAYGDFVRNKEEMEKTRGYDKEYHAKANCEAARRGFTGEAAAYVLSLGKEAKDLYVKVVDKKMDFDVVVQDCMEDIEADLYGIKKSKEKGKCEDLVKDVGKLYKK